MYLSEIIKVVNGKYNLKDDVKIKEIKTDTRKITKGDIFIALNGKNYDGHDYVNEAIKKGAIACISEQEINGNCIVVDSTYKSLFDLGKYIRNKYNIPLIAITGSNGKTTTKELLSHILSSKYNVLKNPDSQNNIIGVSDTLFKLNQNHEIIVMELGTNHLGEISELSNMCNPDVGIITNIGSSHLEYFKKRKNIFKEKLSIRDGMNNNNLIINGDDKYLKKLKYYKCGSNKNNDLRAYNIKEELDKVTFNIYLDREYKIVFNNPGKHFINDILLAIKVSLYYKVKITKIIKKVKTFKMTDKRMNIIEYNGNIIINDCYNASYESIKCGFEYLKLVKDNKVIIIGDILELGKHSKKTHKRINKLLKKISNKKVYTVGKYSKYIKGKHFKDSVELIDFFKDNKIDNSYIYVKGSRRMNLDEIVNFLTH
ncbi:MAG: UDP-N-acetylmuramoyl-tripeptide--D-alanyl-D-alanine ligase [Bacilli bacterium]|nr:UDP-N-acetylmuramoyl-tripeptide--D-alanyl-D-alanine ligase [Bacilli bacterium]